MNKPYFSTTTGTGSLDASTYLQTTVTSSAVFNNQVLKKSVKKETAPSVEKAVYSYIQAMRALGKTELSANEIAKNLSISPFEVNGAIEKLHKKGVRILSRK